MQAFPWTTNGLMVMSGRLVFHWHRKAHEIEGF